MSEAGGHLDPDEVRRLLHFKKQEERLAKTHCSFCGKNGADISLKSCARCRCFESIWLIVRN